MKMIYFILFSKILLAGGWNQKKGSVFLKLETRYSNALELFNGSPEWTGAGKMSYKNYYTSIYSEIGLYEDLTLILKAANSSLSISNIDTKKELVKTISNNDFADSAIGIRYGISQKKVFVSALYLEINIPTGDDSNEHHLYTGDGEWNYKIGVELGLSLGKKGYSVFSIYNNVRSKNFLNEHQANFEAGYQIHPKVLTSFKFQHIATYSGLNAENATLLFKQYEYNTSNISINYNLNSNYTLSFNYETPSEGLNHKFASSVYAFGIVLNV